MTVLLYFDLKIICFETRETQINSSLRKTDFVEPIRNKDVSIPMSLLIEFII